MRGPVMPFKKGEGGGKLGRKSPQPTQLLKDMREAYRSPGHVEGEAPGLKLARDLLEKDPDKFLTRLERQERELRAGRPAAGGEVVEDSPSPVREDDPGEAAVLLACDEFERWCRERLEAEGLEPR